MRHKPATLVILTPGFPSDEGDSSCLPAQQVFVRALNRNYPQLRVILIAFEYPHRADTYRWNGNKVFSLGGWKKSKWNKVFTLWRVWQRLRRLHRGDQLIGLLSFWCGPCALAGKYFSRWSGLPHFTWILGQDAREGNQFMKWIRPKAETLAAMSVFLAEEMERNYGVRPAHIVENGIETELFNGEELERDIDILGVGNLTPLKRYDVLVSVVSSLSYTIPGVRAVICGKGEEGERLQQMARVLGLREQVEFAGELPHAAVLQRMRRAKILLHPSSYEGFSTVCIEALYAGAHVISFVDMGGKPVPNWHIVKTEAEMVAKARELLRSPDTRYASVSSFTMDESARAMMDLYGYRDIVNGIGDRLEG